jgi:hypothetical protein
MVRKMELFLPVVEEANFIPDFFPFLFEQHLKKHICRKIYCLAGLQRYQDVFKTVTTAEPGHYLLVGQRIGPSNALPDRVGVCIRAVDINRVNKSFFEISCVNSPFILGSTYKTFVSYVCYSSKDE